MSARHEQSKFLGTAFWVVGGFCAYWETQVFSAAHRFGEVELPVFGKCFESEAVIFTLSLGWLPLLILHLIVLQHQRLGGARRRFPGVMANLKIPVGMKWIRGLLFVALCLWPTFVHVFLTGRAYDHYVIVPSGVINTEPDSAKWPAARSWKIAVYPLIRPPWEKCGARWWVNTRDEWTEVRRAESDGSSYQVKAQVERVATSALWFQPLLFDLVALGLSASSVALLVGGFLPAITRDSEVKER
jgi:hypothetical protein